MIANKTQPTTLVILAVLAIYLFATGQIVWAFVAVGGSLLQAVNWAEWVNSA